MATMHAVRIHQFGGPEVMQIEDLPIPEPRDDELLIRVHAASVNPVDHKTRAGAFPVIGEDQLPITLGRDVSGVVEARGILADTFEPGEAVFALLGPEHGGFAEYVTVKGAHVAQKPASLGHVQAAAVPLAALTAWQGLFDHGGLREGQHVLIHGGAGGVGHFAIQFAKAEGANVLTTVSGQDLDFARALGADVAVDYKTQDFAEIARDLELIFDLVFDLVGGETQDRSWPVLRPGGTLVSTLGEPPSDKAALYQTRGVGYMARPNGIQLAEIGRLVETGQVRPHIEAAYPLAQAREAEERQEQGHVPGKLVLEIAA